MKLKPPPIAPALMSQLSAPAHGMTERWYLDNAPKLVPTFRKGKPAAGLRAVGGAR